MDTGLAELVPDRDRPRAFTLLLDGRPQSHVDLDDPRRLDFEYQRRLGHVVDSAPPGPLRVLHLGGGALTLPRYVAATRPGSGQQVVDVDGALLDLVRRELPLDRAARVRLRTGDARPLLDRSPAAAFDIVLTDVFSSGRVPASLASTEFAASVARALRPGGAHVANLTDGSGLDFARSQVAAALDTWPHAAVLADPGVLAGRRFGNLILVASQGELPLADYRRRTAADPFPGRVLHGAELERFASGARPRSDADARPSPTPPNDTVLG